MMSEKRPRQSRQELRALLLETGTSILRDEGLGTGAEALTFKKVFDRLERETGIRVTNASVIGRVWRNQASFQADVLAGIALTQNQDEIERTAGSVAPVLVEVDRTTLSDRERALTELCRRASAANMQAMRASSTWPLWISVWGLAAGQEPLDYRKEIVSALVSGYRTFNERIETVYALVIDFLGLRIRQPFTLRQFTVAADSLGQGFGLRDRVDDYHKTMIIRPTGPDGADQEWTIFGIALEALIHQFFEIDPNWRPAGGPPVQP